MAQKSKEFKNLNCKVDIKVSDELEKFIARLDKGEINLIRKLKSMNIEIGDVTLKKNKKYADDAPAL